MKTRIIFVVATFLFAIPQSVCAQNKPFVPTDFIVPDTLQNERFRIRMLNIEDTLESKLVFLKLY